MIFTLLSLIKTSVIDESIAKLNEESIKPGDGLILYLQYQKELYLAMDEGILVFNNTILNDYQLDTAVPVSIRRIDEVFYGLLFDMSPVCSYGLFNNVAECESQPDGDDTWILTGNDESLTIQGRGGCLTRYSPTTLTENFKHGVRIDFCDGNEDQKFTIRRNLM